MSTNERDTHFQGFAELLQVDLAALNSRQWSLLDEYIYAKKQLIAQRAYDLVYFLINEAPTDYSSFNAGYGTPDEIRETIEHLPDLDAWPPTTAE